MTGLYVTSLQSGSGKTTVCAGLARHLLNDGKRVGFLKPIITGGQDTAAGSVDSDVAFMKQLLGLEEPVELLGPAFSDDGRLKAGFRKPMLGSRGVRMW